ncbi:MAG: hypothetical protein ACI8W3_001488 [Myxococcota bacterium]|jgi:hypothetical protein
MTQKFSSRVLRFTGVSVALVFVVTLGACKDSGGGSGSASCGKDECKLTASDAGVSDTFGFGVAISGDIIIAGASQDDEGGLDAGAAYIYERDGSQWRETQKLLALVPSAGARLGTSVGIDGDFAVVGAPTDSENGQNTGAAFVFRFDGDEWVQEVKLTAADFGIDDNFGRAVGISGDVVVVGAPRDDDADTNTGSVYVFRRTAMVWTQEAKLNHGDPETSDYFGGSVSIDGDAIVIGAPGNDNGTSNDFGAAYVFRFGGVSWTEEQRILPLREPLAASPECNETGPIADAYVGDSFGTSVDIDDDVIVIGADFAEFRSKSITCALLIRANDAGSAYVYRDGGGVWDFEAKLTAADFNDDQLLGRSVSISGDVIVVGARGYGALSTQIGAVYQYSFDGLDWSQERQILSSDGVRRDYFGESVGVDAGKIVVGSYGRDDFGPQSGAAYVYEQ